MNQLAAVGASNAVAGEQKREEDAEGAEEETEAESDPCAIAPAANGRGGDDAKYPEEKEHGLLYNLLLLKISCSFVSFLLVFFCQETLIFRCHISDCAFVNARPALFEVNADIGAYPIGRQLRKCCASF